MPGDLPLLDDLVARHGYPSLDEAGVDALLADGGNVVLFFTGDSTRYPETLGVAVILPERTKRFEGRCRIADRGIPSRKTRRLARAGGVVKVRWQPMRALFGDADDDSPVTPQAWPRKA